MNRFTKTLAAFGAIALLAACGPRVEVSPTQVGVILDENGYKPEVITPSKFRLPVCMPWEACPELIVIEISDRQVKETLDLFMPQSNLLVDDIEVRFTASILNNKENIRNILKRVTPSRASRRSDYRTVELTTVYSTYVQERVRAIVRQELAKYKVEYVAANRERISTIIFNELREQLSNNKSPIQVTQFSLAKFNPPKVIVDAYVLAEQRKIDLARVQAEKDLAIKRAEAKLEIERKQAEIRLLRAEAFKREARTMAEAVTPGWLHMRQLEVMEKMALNPNTVFYPFNMSSNPVALRTMKLLEKK